MNNLPGVMKATQDLKHLWKTAYNYPVFICNEKTSYATKQDIISFMDEHLYIINVQNHAYNAVIVHIISHSDPDSFMTSDGKRISTDFIKHELIQESTKHNNKSLIKILFHHGCRGEENYYAEGNFNDNSKEKTSSKHQSSANIVSRMSNNNNINNISADSNVVTVYGTIKGRKMSDHGLFTRCICKAFEANIKRTIKADFNSLLVEIGRNLEQMTESAEVCEVTGTLRFDRIRFEVCKDINKRTIEEDIQSNHNHHNHEYDYYDPIQQHDVKYRSIPQNQLVYGGGDNEVELYEHKRDFDDNKVEDSNDVIDNEFISTAISENNANANSHEIDGTKQIAVSMDIKLSLHDVNQLVESHRDIIISALASDIVKQQSAVNANGDAKTVTNSSKSYSNSNPIESTKSSGQEYSHRNTDSHLSQDRKRQSSSSNN